MDLHFNQKGACIYLWKRNGLVKEIVLSDLYFDNFITDFDYILFLKFDTKFPSPVVDISDLIISLDQVFDYSLNPFLILTGRQEPALYQSRADEFLYSFTCSVDLLKDLMFNSGLKEIDTQDLLFILLDQIFEGHSNFKELLVKQLPIVFNKQYYSSEFDVIIPHKGKDQYLKNVLFFLNQLKLGKLYVGIDQDISTLQWEFLHKSSETLFYYFHPNPVGPYVIRNYLIQESKNDLIFFQDSDDISCADRFGRISEFMLINDCQLCGSHELRMDYFNKKLRAIRFPTNVKEALKANASGHPLLHPTSAIKRAAFNLCGKFAEDQTFGYDTQFLLRSFFYLKSVMNVDEFLYIRRLRPGSLTTDPATMHGSPLREKYLATWYKDFALINSNDLLLENSSLNYIASESTFEVMKM